MKIRWPITMRDGWRGFFEKRCEPHDVWCPTCGYYCYGNGGIGCINKPALVFQELSKAGLTADEEIMEAARELEHIQRDRISVLEACLDDCAEKLRTINVTILTGNALTSEDAIEAGNLWEAAHLVLHPKLIINDRSTSSRGVAE